MDWLRGILYGLGVLVGALSRHDDPEMRITVFRAREMVYINCTMEHVMNDDVVEILESGIGILITLQVDADSAENAVTHLLDYEPLSGDYIVSLPEQEVTQVTQNERAAELLFLYFPAVPVTEVSSIGRGGLSFRVEATLSLEEVGDFDPAMLWNYRNPAEVLSYESASGIPY